jgi:diguanylate cyclase (GGDEF)-like protein
LQLEKESNIDPLTKLYNKRALIKDMENILDFGKDKDLDLALIIFDLDDFKKINDTYGHIAGDKTLIYIGKVLKGALRKETKTYRFGGEEFVVMLNRVDIQEAKRTADRMLKTISESKLIYKNNTIQITMSGGITSHKAGDTIDSIIERADKALYEAKSAGKNRIVVS